MKIAGSNWHIPGAESLYRQFKPQAAPQETNPQKQAEESTVSANNNSTDPKSVLSARELDTLKALFGDSANGSFYYGRNQVRNVSSGHLLDVKG